MRNKFWNRVLVALSGLFIFAAGVLLFLVSFLSLFSISLSLGGTELSQLLNGLAVWQKILLMLGGVAVAALGLHDLSIPFPSRRDRGFIMQHTELGDMSISMNALDTMVRHCVDQHKELTVKSTRISRVKSGIVVEIRIMLAAGVNIPLTVNALQKYNFTKGFFGANGISLENGCTTPDANEAMVKTEAIKKCDKAYILADKSKFDENSFITFCKMEDVIIITDKEECEKYKTEIFKIK